MSAQDDLYRKAVNEYGAALERLARAYEAGPEDRRDLLQEIHIALWRSFTGFDERCFMRVCFSRGGNPYIMGLAMATPPA